ncbi:MAG: hypothetical protein EBR07_01675 [Planctomycetes bacterium]|nr:hypothetical protein [Planctomycetota bacterium]
MASLEITLVPSQQLVVAPGIAIPIGNLTKADLGLGNVDNTSDVAKPISSATQAALNGKAATSHTHPTSDVAGLDSALAGKAATSHTHTASQITDFAAAVSAAAPPTTNASLLTSGTLPDDRLSAGVTTSLGKADSALQPTALTPYRTASAQDTIDAGKQPAGSYATLDGTGKIFSTQLPSYVDDVLDYATLAAFPSTGETGKIYVATGTGKVYRWSGSAYVEICPSPGSTDAVPEGANNLYFSTARAVSALASTLASYATTSALNSAINGLASVYTTTAAVASQITAYGYQTATQVSSAISSALTSYATTASVSSAISSLVTGVSSVAGKTGAVTLTAADIGAAALQSADVPDSTAQVLVRYNNADYVLNVSGTVSGRNSYSGPVGEGQGQVYSTTGSPWYWFFTFDISGSDPQTWGSLSSMSQYPWLANWSGSGTTVSRNTVNGTQPLAASSAGVATTASRSDHVHDLPTPAQIGAATAAQGAKADTALQSGTAISTISGLQTALNAKEATITTLPITKGGTGATTASAARTSLGLGTAATTAATAYATSAQGAKADSALQSGAAISNISGLQTALDGKQEAGNYANATHTHAIADTNGLQAALDGKQAAGSYVQASALMSYRTATAQDAIDAGKATAAQGAKADSAIQSSTTGLTGATALTNIVQITQAGYNAITTQSASTLYIIVG